MRAKRQQPERAEQRAILDLLRLVHAQVWVLGTVRQRGDWPGTRQTPGLPDIIASIPVREIQVGRINRQRLEIEVKAPQGRLSQAQGNYRAHALSGGIEHLVGGIDAVLAWLRERGHRV